MQSCVREFGPYPLADSSGARALRRDNIRPRTRALRRAEQPAEAHNPGRMPKPRAKARALPQGA